jgi:hypothetical protein
MGRARARWLLAVRAVRGWLGRTGTLGSRYGSAVPTVEGRPDVPVHLLLGGGVTAVGALVARNALGVLFLRALPAGAVLGESLWALLIVVSAIGALISNGVAQLVEPSRFPFSDDVERW